MGRKPLGYRLSNSASALLVDLLKAMQMLKMDSTKELRSEILFKDKVTNNLQSQSNPINNNIRKMPSGRLNDFQV